MLEIDLVRHVQSEKNRVVDVPRVGGQLLDVGITAQGIRQRIGLRERLGTYDAVYASPAKRAVETIPQFDPIIDDRIVEISRGDWEDQPLEETFTDELRERLRNDEVFSYAFRAPNGESAQDVADRFVSFINELEDPGNYLVVSHSTAIRCGVARLLGWPPRNIYRTELDNAALTRIWYEHGVWRLVKWNDTGHLTCAF